MSLLFPFPIISYFLYSIPERGCKRRKITIAQSALTHTRTHIIVHFCPLCCCFANARPLRAKSRLASFVYVPTCIIYVDLYFFFYGEMNRASLSSLIDAFRRTLVCPRVHTVSTRFSIYFTRSMRSYVA